jgi:hypothetical protein
MQQKSKVGKRMYKRTPPMAKPRKAPASSPKADPMRKKTMNARYFNILW